jgi:iron(III) transport system permease protein
MSTTTVAAPQSGALRTQLRLRRLFIIGAPLAVGIIVTLPLVLLLANSFNIAQPGREASYGLENWVRAFSDPTTVSSLWMSIALGGFRTIISLPIALAVAWLIARSDMPGRGVVELLCWLGIFLPLLPPPTPDLRLDPPA